jgi:hypothetical protein
MSKKNWVFIFLPIILLTAIASFVSLLTSDFYYRDSATMAVKSHYLDLINISIVVPIGVMMFVLAMKKSHWAKLFILGIMAYLAYMFGFNALSLYFNELFLVYVAVFGLSIFGIILGYGDVQQSGNYLENPIKMRISGIYLMLFSVIAYIAWLIEIILSTVNGSIPESISGMNLPVNVVHVFDMAFALPIIIIGAVLLFKGKMSGLIISSIMVAFVFLTCISMLTMELGLQYHNMHFDEGQLYSMYVLTPLGIFPLITLFRAVSKISSDIKYG